MPQTRISHRKLITLALLITMILCGACGKKEAQHSQKPLVVGWSLWNGWYPMALAQELKLFEKHGVAVRPVLYRNYSDILPDLSSGKLDAGFSGMYETLKANIPDIRIVLVTDHSNGAEGLIVAPSIRSPGDLRGKRIGTQGALSGSEFLITTYLRIRGISPRDITMLSVPPENVLEQMPRKIQGGYTWDPFLTQGEKKGYRLLFTTADMPGLIVDIVAFHGAVAKSRPEDVKAFVRAWFEAQEYWRDHPDKARTIIARVTGLKEEVSSSGCRIFYRADNLRTFRKGSSYDSVYFTARKQVEFFISVGDATTAPDIERILMPGFLQ